MRRFLLIPALFVLASCATLAHGRYQTVEIRSEPPGARVFIGSTLLGVTPVQGNFKRRESHLVLRFEMDGYQPASVSLERRASAWIAADAAFGPLQFANQGLTNTSEMAKAAVIAPSILIGVDLATGAAFKLPSRVSVVLKPAAAK